MHEIVARHEQHRDAAVPHELRRDAEDEVAAEHALAERRQHGGIDVRPAADFLAPQLELVVERGAVLRRQPDRVLQHERCHETRPRGH
jgi:hypothetical protein